MSARAWKRAIAGVATAGLAGTVLAVGPAGSALADDTPAPVVADDTISLYPGESGTIDVLENDSAPSGQDLALCRFPEVDFTGTTMPPAIAFQDTQAGPGVLDVLTSPSRHRDTEIDYYVCDHVHLTPAVLTVHVKPVAPVVVTAAPRPGRLEVTNTNGARVVWVYGSRKAKRPDGRVRLAAGETRVVPVHRHAITWVALIGHGGIADHGTVRDIALPRG